MSATSSEIVHPGACFVGDRFVRCALDEPQCEGMDFKSQTQVVQENNYRATETCLERHPDHIGMCASNLDDYMCTNIASNCANENSFVQNSIFCGIRYNHFPDRNFHLSLYGKCTGLQDQSGTCVWSPNDCPAFSTYTPPSHSTAIGNQVDTLCTCDKVRTGACISDFTGDKTCAVSVEACDATSSFKTWQELALAGDSCFLCDPFSKNEAASPVQPDGFAGESIRTGMCASDEGSQMLSIIAVSMSAIFLIVATVECCSIRRNTKNNSSSSNSSSSNKVAANSNEPLPEIA